MKTNKAFYAMGAVMLVMAWGCSDEDHDHAHDHEAKAVAVNAPAVPDPYFLAEAPEGAAPIQELRQTAKEGDSVVIRGVIGGRKDPISTDRAVMTVVDAAMKSQCLSPDDACTTPWDYCCDDMKQVTAHSASVQIQDDQGKLLAASFAADGKFKPLQTVVVKGKVGPRPDPGVFNVLVEGIYAEPMTP